MKEETLKAGVSEDRFDRIVIAKFEKHPEVVNEFLRRLKPLWDEVVKVRGYVSPDMWEVYKLIGVKDQAEQILLRDAQKALRLIWKRPTVKTYIIEANNPVPFEFLLKDKCHVLTAKDAIVSVETNRVLPEQSGNDEANRGHDQS